MIDIVIYYIVQYEMLEFHGGIIREALNLEFPGVENYDHLGVFVGICKNIFILTKH